jgi:hypothetical protein
LKADELLDAPSNLAAGRLFAEKARRFLEHFLLPGPRLVRDIWEAGKALGISERSLRSAKEDLELRTVRVGKGREHRAYWRFEHQQFPSDIPADDVPPDLSPWLDPLIAAYPAPTPLEDD